MKEKSSSLFLRILILLLVIFSTILLFIYRDEIKELSRYGYAGVFLLSVLANATVIFPLPGVLFTSAMGAIFSPVGVAIAAGAGATLGELTGYAAGFSGNAVIQNRKWYDRFSGWMEKYGNVALFVLALIPNPLFDLAGIAAGIMGMKISKFLFWCFLGKLLKMLIFALTGEKLFILFSS
jgi:uncharacterized membrane protein YdjX (TVP38/TMEM64 family)